MKLPNGPWRKGGGKPLISFEEAAKEFGVSAHYLAGMMAKYPNAPKMIAGTNSFNNGGKRSKYYDATSFRQWWAVVKPKEPK